MDTTSDHAMHCHNNNRLKNGRHDQIQNTIFKEAQHASFNPTKEMPGLVPNSVLSIYVANWIEGRKMAFDVSVVSPTQDTVLQRAADSAINLRKLSKNRAYFENCHLQGFVFKPLIVETFGGWDRDAVQFLKEIARLDACR